MKKLILYFISIIIIATGTPVISSPFTDVPDTATYKDAASILAALGIMEGNNGAFRPDDAITRAETTKVLCVASGYTSSVFVGNKSEFVDVDSSKWYANVVSTGSALGFIKGSTKDGKKYFYPEREVTYTEFAIMAIRVLGYENDLPSKDNMSYAAKAVSLGLFSNLSPDLNISLKAPRKDVAVMLYNMLNTPSKAESTKENPKPLIYSIQAKLGVTVVSGILTTPAVDATITPNKVKIGINEYEIAVSNSQELLNSVGKYITAYVKQGKIVLVSQIKGSVTNIILSKNSDAGIMYYKDSAGVDKIIQLDPYVKLYVNGKAAYSGYLSLKSGAVVTAINTDDDSDIDFVNAAYTAGPFIVPADIASDAPLAVGSIGSISLKKFDGTEARVAVTGAASKLSEIKKDDVFYVTATDDNSIINLEVVRKSVTGQVTSVILPSGTTVGTVTINGNSYKYNGSLLTINILDNKKYIIDKTDTIIAAVGGTISSPAINALNYGIITSITPMVTIGGITNQIRIKRLDGTEIIAQTTMNLGETWKNVLVYFVVDANGVLIDLKNTTYATIKKVNIVPDTKVYAIRISPTGGTTVEQLKPSEINIQDNVTLGFQVVKPGSILGDYGIIAVVNPSLTSVDTTGYGVIIRKAGAEVVAATSEVLDLYEVYINGEFKTIKVRQGIVVPTIFSQITMTSNIVTAFTPLASNNMVTGKLDIRDDTRIKLQGNANIYMISPNVKVFNLNGGVKLATLSIVDQAPINDMTLIVDYSTGTPTVVMILVNK